MIYTSENNWYIWQYGDDNPFGRQTAGLEFKTRFNKFYDPINTFGEELRNAAKSTLEHYPGLRPAIFFSGGVDSEIVLRAYLDIGANPEVCIIRYENDINILDVSYAIAICSSLGVNFRLIDFNLKKFYENDAEKISEYAQIDFPKALPQLKFIDYTDGLPILCSGDPSWCRTDEDYTKHGTWTSKCYEHEVGWSKYIRYIDRPAIAEWLKWTPGLVLSYTKLNWFKKLINDEYYGKLGVNSTKIFGYREAYPDLILRKKLTGFESIEHLIGEFELCLMQKYNGLPFRNEVIRSLDDMWTEITQE